MQTQKTIQINEVVVSMELIVGIFEYINQVNRPFTEKEPYMNGIREAINIARIKEEAKQKESVGGSKEELSSAEPSGEAPVEIHE